MYLSISDRILRQRTIERFFELGYAPVGVGGGKGSAVTKAADELGIARSTLFRWLNSEQIYVPDETLYQIEDPEFPLENKTPLVEYSGLPDDDISVEAILDILEERNQKKIENQLAKEWQKIKINSNEPCVIAFVGDPHLDDNGCNIKLLREHVELLNKPNVYAFNIGDTTNNWTGRLMRLYADQDTSLETARKLIKWFLADSGVNWLGWVLGNHDEWEHGSEITRLMNVNRILMENWEARVKVEFPSGLDVPMWLAHNFKGSSQYNKVHGAVRASRDRRGAAVYVCGHTHDYAAYTEELPDTGQIVHSLRARGYKYVDHYAVTNGFAQSKNGATVAVVIDPNAENLSEAITPFVDLQKAVMFRDKLAEN